MEKLLAWLPERPQPLIVRYGTTAIMVAIWFAVLRLVQLQSGVDSFFLMYPGCVAWSSFIRQRFRFLYGPLEHGTDRHFSSPPGRSHYPPILLVTCHTILADRSCARGSQRSPAQSMGARDR